MMSIREKIQSLQNDLAASIQERDAFKASTEEYGVHVSALEAQLAEKNGEVEALKAQIAERDALIQAKAGEVEAVKVEAEKANKELESAKAQMELVPLADVSEGSDPVVEGGVASDPVDHEAEISKLKTSAERIAYYRKHIEKKG